MKNLRLPHCWTKQSRQKNLMRETARNLRSLSLLTLAIVMGFAIDNACAFENDFAHPSITRAAVNLANVEEVKAHCWALEHPEGTQTAPNPQCSWIDEGSTKEDQLFVETSTWSQSMWGASTCGVDRFTFLDHGYNPMVGASWMGGILEEMLENAGIIGDDDVRYGNALERGSALWRQAVLDYHLDSGYGYFKLGRVCHLLEDMASPAHAHADPHFPAWLAWLLGGRPDDTEDLGKDSSFDFLTQGAYQPETIRRPSTHGATGMDADTVWHFIRNLAWETYYGSSFQAELCRLCVIFGEQPDSELKRMFPDLRYDIELSTMRLGWVIDDVGWLYDFDLDLLINPIESIIEAIWEGSTWWACPGDPGYYYLEDIVDDTTGTPAIPEKKRGEFFQRIYVGDDLDAKLESNSESLVELYAKNLYPRAGEWVAGLIRFYVESVETTPQQQAIANGIEWLRAQQLSNGSWSNEPAVTSLAVLAMLNWGYDDTDPVVADGLDYLTSPSVLHSDGSVGPESGRYTYRTSIAILPLVATHNSDYHDEITKMRNWLIGSQWDESSYYGSVGTGDWKYGGFGYGNSGWADLSNTQWALMGIRAADDELSLNAGSTYDKCVDYFLARCQYGDGGSGYWPHYGTSIHTMTAASVWSYALCGVLPGDSRIDRGIQWLLDQYSLTSNDGWGHSSDYYYAVTFAKALTMSHKTMLGLHDWYAELSELLMNRQTANGNWPGGGWLSGQADLELTTCYSILSLQTRQLAPGEDMSVSIILASHADLHVYDPQGRHMGVDYETDTIEENIPGATFQILDADGNEVPYDGNTPGEGMRQVVNLPVLAAGSYRIELVGTSDGPFDLTINGVHDGNTVTTETYEGDIVEGQRLATNVTVTSMEGALTLLYEPLSELPTLGVEPTELEVVVAPDAVADFSFTVSEVGGQETLHGVSMYCTDIDGPDGHIDGSSVSCSPTGFDIPAGGQQVVTAYIPVPAGFTGPCTGSLVVESTDGGAKSIALTLLTDVTGPEVQIVVPALNQALQDGVTLSAEANDVSGVDAVWLYIREPNDGNGVPIGYEELPATLNGVTGKWELPFDTTLLPDGYYVILAKAIDTYGNVGWSELVPFSIRNWAVVELLPASAEYRAGRTMPVKFSLRIAEAVDPAMPFVYNEELEIRIYKASKPSNILQTSLFGDASTDYRINSTTELYITNFKTAKKPTTYVVEIWRLSKNFLIDTFNFETARK